LFEHAQDRQDLFRALAGSRGGAVALATIRRVISEAVRKELAETADKAFTASIPRELIVQFVVGAYMAVLTWWLVAKLPAPRSTRCSGVWRSKASSLWVPALRKSEQD
jgi:hypothetical protein